MNNAQLKYIRAAEAEARRRIAANINDDDDFDAEVENVLQDWAAERAEDRMLYGEPEDTFCIESADIYGTGEGRFHGVI